MTHLRFGSKTACPVAMSMGLCRFPLAMGWIMCHLDTPGKGVETLVLKMYEMRAIGNLYFRNFFYLILNRLFQLKTHIDLKRPQLDPPAVNLVNL